MNLKLEAVNILKWIHFLALAFGGGAAVVALLLSGFEEGREDLQGLAATVWAKVVAWSFRLALLVGIALLVVLMQNGQNPFKAGIYFHIKLTLVFVLIGLSEMTPKALAVGKRGSALLVVVLFMAVTFTVFNKGLFRREAPKAPPVPVAATAGPVAR
ncbi:MAG: hypothetical protein IPP58_02570 [Holophagaceae bacterium]|uniref:DUF2269 family protein n=1 Tax=Candidatus Geothrix skivensis TaxID=2954439 RepID=A0A9D7XH73_9BACT|nr:hypothetical protein [Candidatus Geothrix skivensis]